MPKPLPVHITGLLAYLSQPAEKANEDLALAYFRQVYGDDFTRQKEAHQADGYVKGSFVLELKGTSKDWLSGLFQGLAYRNQGLDFSQVVVAAKDFLALWQVSDLREDLRDEVLSYTEAPNRIGTLLAKKYRDKATTILKSATWRGDELSGSLFLSHPELLLERIKTFEKALREGRKVRQRVTPKNFAAALKEMKTFFDPDQPVKTVRGFYSMVYGWNEGSTVLLSHKANEQATLGGELITNLVPSKRGRFKEFVEERAIHLGPNENLDDFFARYDEALDAVDRDFRIKHGIFFTDRDLSKFVLWIVRQHLPDLGKNYMVIDPACGSGNLVTNWRSPLEIRHKVVSEIEPELLFAVEQRMKGDQWHNGKYTVVPKVAENKGLNFLDCSAKDYLAEIRRYLKEKGLAPDKPLAFLCNPPYRSDEDQAAGRITYKIHDSIVDVTGADARNERYCCFLAQMKLICDAAESSGLPGDSLLLLFTKSAWLTDRAVFRSIRHQMCGVFEDVAGILIEGQEFFDVKGSWPVAFTLWRYKPKDVALDPDRPIPLMDLTKLKKSELKKVPWDSPGEMEKACHLLVEQQGSTVVEIGQRRTSIREWSGQTMVDFKRDRRKAERDQKIVGGLPAGDRRQDKKKTYGETNGPFIGFMDDLTPCRVKYSDPGKPWFRLNNQFMDIKKNRCFSGPPTNRGYCASDLDSAKKLFLWYAMARTFLQHAYPMWVDADDMWEPSVPQNVERQAFQAAFAIGYAENECVETRFPANNPVPGVPELAVNNPMTPVSKFSFWSTTLKPYCDTPVSPTVGALIRGVDELFEDWSRLFDRQRELPLSPKPYTLDDRGVTAGAGLQQIKAYAVETDNKSLLAGFAAIQSALKAVKSEFFGLLREMDGLNYFGPQKKAVDSARGASAPFKKQNVFN